jgi:nucleotide-binding universal stress UspA family protein
VTAGSTVLCAVDLGPQTGRVLYHAAGLARVLGLPYKVLHVAAAMSPRIEGEVADACAKAALYELPFDNLDVLVRTGAAAEVVGREAAANRAALVVMGTGTHGGLMTLLLGSTSAAVLEHTEVPVLLVPPTEFDIVNFGDHVTLTCGPVLAAIDLAEESDRQVDLASRLAALGGQPLILLTVADRRDSDQVATEQLRQRAHRAAPVKPRSLIVRRGEPAEEISRCAAVEGAGLVVMGLRDRGRGRPGRLAAAVLKTGRAFVLAVPN